MNKENYYTHTTILISVDLTKSTVQSVKDAQFYKNGVYTKAEM
jgi:hypothetical protein